MLLPVAVLVSKQESHLMLSFNSEHVSQLCPSGSLPKGIHLVSRISSSLPPPACNVTVLFKGYVEGKKPASIRSRLEHSDTLTMTVP